MYVQGQFEDNKGDIIHSRRKENCHE